MPVVIALLSVLVICLITYIIISQKRQRKNLIAFWKEQAREEIAEDKKRYIENAKNEYRKEKDKLEQEFQENKSKIRQDYDDYVKETDKRQKQYKEASDKNIQLLKENLEQIKETTAQSIENQSSIIEKVVKEKFDEQVDEYFNSVAKIEDEVLAAASKEFNDVINDYQKQIDDIKLVLDDYYKKRNVVNEEILRQRAINEQQDFYRVNLSENAISDIEILQSIRPKLSSPENLNKLIYDNYIAKPVLEMTKRVLKGTAPSGIYKITRLNTNEIYIGKSTDVKTRWTNHCKTVFGVGSIAHSILHTTMERDGIQNFTFELLEEVPKDKLAEKEKYWINFYDSKKYGLNEREG